ncbi:lipopolysaccharide biosynthesis protein [Bacillus cereus group sp. TH260-2LC]|uniref:lipopolysaccharide biosynthesis protein n=1 Tax=unclassified Bacillus cereus group TaxID=2750818 RepID=UPI0022E85EF2|nr:oligosaccharide flippase family protein [Bacillus cereus group sp. TH260-2LC]MDA1529863.1 oligosaccharide flippase family protein [Bacillus cereus group sp. TH260-2LC]
MILGNIKKRIGSNSYLKNIFIIASGTALGQLIAFLASPIISRIYSPSDFGIVSVYSSILAVFLVIASLRYEFAISLPKRDEDAINLVTLSLIIVIILSLFSGIVIWIMSNLEITRIYLNKLGLYKWLIPISILGMGSYQVLNYWAIRKSEYKLIAKTKITQNVSQVATYISVGLFKSGPIGLILGDIIGKTSGVRNFCSLILKENKNLFKSIKIKEIIKVGKRYKEFPLISSVSSVINILGLQIAPIAFVLLFGEREAGLYSFGHKMITIPLMVLGQAVAQVYIGEVSKVVKGKKKELKPFFVNTIKKLFLIGIVPIVVLSVGGRLLFSIVFGSEWGEAGYFLQLMSPMYLAFFIVFPISQTLNILEMQKKQFIWDLLRLVLVITIFSVVYLFNISIYNAIILYSFVMAVTYLLLLLIVYKSINNIFKGANEEGL